VDCVSVSDSYHSASMATYESPRLASFMTNGHAEDETAEDSDPAQSSTSHHVESLHAANPALTTILNGPSGGTRSRTKPTSMCPPTWSQSGEDPCSHEMTHLRSRNPFTSDRIAVEMAASTTSELDVYQAAVEPGEERFAVEWTVLVEDQAPPPRTWTGRAIKTSIENILGTPLGDVVITSDQTALLFMTTLRGGLSRRRVCEVTQVLGAHHVWHGRTAEVWVRRVPLDSARTIADQSEKRIVASRSQPPPRREQGDSGTARPSALKVRQHDPTPPPSDQGSGERTPRREASPR
jgi:hypothetical protein